MTKIFIQSDELEEVWFEELPLEFSYLWLILKLNCNKGGLVNINERRLSYWAKFEVKVDQLINYFKNQITVFEDKLFINKFFADQNGYELNLSNDAIRGRLKSFFEHPELSEKLLRELGYKFFINKKDKYLQLCNIKEFLNRYQKPPQEIELIDKYFIYNDEPSNIIEAPIGVPIGVPRNSISISNSNSNSISNEIKVNEDIRKNILLTYETYNKEVIDFKNVISIKNQLTKDEFNKLLKIESGRKIDSKVFWNAVEDLNKDKKLELNSSVYESLADILILPF